MSERPLLVMLRPLGLGDFLTGVPAYRALAAAFPNHRRVLAASERYASLARLAGGIDGVVDTRALEPLPQQLHHADVAVDLHGRGPASHRILLASGAQRLIAFANAAIPLSRSFPAWRAEEHEVLRWCRMLTQSGVPADPADLTLPPPAAAIPRRLRGATLVHPGASAASRRWPIERWTLVARELVARGETLLITGGDDEVDLGDELALRAGLPARSVLAGRTSLLELAAIVAHAKLVLCGDTGIAHLATAFARPSVTLFGPTAPRNWGPPARPQHRILWRGTTGNPHAETIDAGLLAIGVRDVLEQIEALAPLMTPPDATAFDVAAAGRVFGTS